MNYFGNRCKMEKYKGPDGKLKTAIDCLSIKTRTGTKIVVPFGANTKTANNAWHGWRVAGFCIDELDRLCEESITEAKQRITTVNNPHIIMTMNPPNPRHPICEWIDELIEKDLINYSRWILDDNVALSAEKIKAIKEQYDPASEYYKRYILGERCGSEGLIYKLNDYNFIDHFDSNDYISYIISCDPGETVSATSIELGAMRKGFKGVDILAEYYHRNASKENRNNQKTNVQYAEELAQFTLAAIEKFDRLPERIILDNGGAFFKDVKAEFSKYSDLRNIYIKYPLKTDIEERIKRSSSLIYQGRLRFKDTCTKTIEAFKTVEYDDKALLNGKSIYLDRPELGTMCDPVDATCYIISDYESDLNRVNYRIQMEDNNAQKV